jgi:hypothetical protein
MSVEARCGEARSGQVGCGQASRSRQGKVVTAGLGQLGYGVAVVVSCVGIGRDRASCGRAVGARSGLVGFGELGHGGHG